MTSRLRVLALARLPRLALAAAFSGRISAAGRTRVAHSAPLGNAAPTGNVVNFPEAGGGGGPVVVDVVVGDGVVDDDPTVSVPAESFHAISGPQPAPNRPTFRV